jgi:exonuclease SbcC
MRIKTIEIQGFGPYLTKQSINFTKYEDDGLFIIVGETGAGKSSILDAITFALYGSAPRWKDTAATKKNQTYRSHFAKDTDPTKVVLTFEVNGQEYRISRSPEYVTSTGKSVPDSVQLETLDDGETIETLAVKEKNVASHILGLLKLSSEEFLQVILLAQGRFDNFLQATSTERMELLSKIFNTGRFKTLEDRIDQLRKRIEQDFNEQRAGFSATLNAIQSQLNEPSPAPGDEVAWLEKLSSKFEELVNKAQSQVGLAQDKQQAAAKTKTMAENQETLSNIKAELKSLEGKSKQIVALQNQLALATSASRIVATFEARNVAQKHYETESSRFAKAQNDITKHEIDPDKKGLDDSLIRLIDELDGLIEVEKRIPNWEASISSLETEIKILDTNFLDYSREVSSASKEILTLEKQELAFESAKALLEKNRPILEKSEELAEVTEEIAELKDSLPIIKQEVIKATSELEAATMEERNNLASILASSLTKGEPCAVCGSKEHPKPHKSTTKSAKMSDSTALRNALVAAESNLQTATGSIKKLEDKQRKLKDSLKDISVAAINRENTSAKKIVDSWPKLSRELKRLRETLKPDSKLNKDIAYITAKLPDSKLRLKTLQETLASARKDISKQLGGFKTIASRKTKASADLTLLRSFKEVKNTLVAAENSLKANEKAFTVLLAKEKFVSESAFIKSILTTKDFKSIEKAVQDHNTEMVRLKGLIAQDIYTSLPSTIVNLASAKANFQIAEDTLKVKMQDLADFTAKHKAISSAQKSLNSFASQMKTLSSKLIVHERLLNTVKGKEPNNLNMPLETFVLAAELEAILEAANYHLGKLSKGQYSFQHTEKTIQRSNAKAGLGIEVMDSHTSIARDAHSLSGGETFLASISLALGLAEVVTGRAGGISIDTLFIDEGFGSLSPEFLDLVIETLDSLRAGGRTIGVISHGETMKERIASQLQVFKEPGGTSKVFQE